MILSSALSCFRVTRNRARNLRLLVEYASIPLQKNKTEQKFSLILAGETRFEHATNGFGDHYSTVEPLPFDY